jgi:leucyl aminopeptidase
VELEVTTGEIAGIGADAIVVGLAEGNDTLVGEMAAVDAALDGAIGQLISQGETKGKLGENTLIHSLGKLPAARVLVAGLGKEADLTEDKIRGIIAGSGRLLRGKGAKSIAIAPLGVGLAGISDAAAGQALAEGARLGLYRFLRHKKGDGDDDNGDIESIKIVTTAGRQAALAAGVRLGDIMAKAAILARDMGNEPANFMTPTDMVREATEIATAQGLEIEVLERDDMEKLGMGALLGVARGSHQPPKFIIMRYRGKPSSKVIDIALCGKAITFDSGGLSLKPAASMGDMHGDMCGGASVLGAMSAIGQIKPKVNVLALVPATENMPGGGALKPTDVITAMEGKTIEIISTDAEGRLVLADALGYARKEKAKRIVDIATLTGACVVALGTVCTGVFGNNQKLVDAVVAAGGKSGEKMWQMPTYDEYKEQNKSGVADIKNTGGRDAGAITGALFIGAFAGDTPWVHLDIAGTNMLPKQRGYEIKGATGVPVRSLVNLVISLAGKK